LAVNEVLRDYEVLAASNGWVDGRRVKIGSTIQLYDSEAVYEMGLGFVKLIGTTTPAPAPVITLGSVFTVTQDGIARPVSIADLVALLAPLLGGGTAPAPADPEAGFLDLSQPLTTNSLGAL